MGNEYNFSTQSLFHALYSISFCFPLQKQSLPFSGSFEPSPLHTVWIWLHKNWIFKADIVWKSNPAIRLAFNICEFYSISDWHCIAFWLYCQNMFTTKYVYNIILAGVDFDSLIIYQKFHFHTKNYGFLKTMLCMSRSKCTRIH